MISRQNSIALFMCISKIELRNLSRILSRTIYAGAGDKIEAFKQQSREATWSVRENRSTDKDKITHSIENYSGVPNKRVVLIRVLEGRILEIN